MTDMMMDNEMTETIRAIEYENELLTQTTMTPPTPTDHKLNSMPEAPRVNSPEIVVTEGERKYYQFEVFQLNL